LTEARRPCKCAASVGEARSGGRRRARIPSAREATRRRRGCDTTTRDAGTTRIERDALGEIAVPADALWGAGTQRALENFPVSGERLPRELLRALGLVKAAAAAANARAGALDAARAGAIERAAGEVADGRLDAHFPLDVFQTGSGTSTNMNANEVIARRARALLGAGAPPVHPNDHVNASQSSNDVMPTALHVAARLMLHERLLPALRRLHGELARQARAQGDVVKPGRTHGMDATPVTLGQELAGHARQVELGIARVLAADADLAELALGGTAVGTGINCPPGFAEDAIARLSAASGLAFRAAADRFEAQGARDAAVHASGALRTLAVSLSKIAGDLRLLASGPRCGLGELRLPALQPGSSIMPGKVNPVLCEVVIQVCAQVIGNDAAIAAGSLSASLELHAALPLVARNLLESIRLLASASALFAERCVAGLEADRERCAELAERSLSLATALVPALGYDAAAELAKEALATGRSLRELCLARGLLDAPTLDRLLDPLSQTGRR
jgi:fumarate hydratase class II